MTHAPIDARCALLCAALAIAAPVHAQAWRFATDAASGTLNSDLDLSAPIPGTVIGDYDAVTNPDGTQTRPGVFGGSGNNPIDFDITLQTAGQSSIAPNATRPERSMASAPLIADIVAPKTPETGQKEQVL